MGSSASKYNSESIPLPFNRKRPTNKYLRHTEIHQDDGIKLTTIHSPADWGKYSSFYEVSSWSSNTDTKDEGTELIQTHYIRYTFPILIFRCQRTYCLRLRQNEILQ